MYSSRLRSSPVWHGVIPSLSHPTQLNLRESSLDPHDIQLALVPIAAGAASASTAAFQSNNTPQLFILLLTPASLTADAEAQAYTRLNRLAHLTPDITSVAIVFLLDDSAAPRPKDTSVQLQASHSTVIGLHAYQSLQHKILTEQNLSACRGIPIIPISSSSALSTAVRRYTTNLSSAFNARQQKARPTQIERVRNLAGGLLPLCTTSGRLSEDAVMRILDVGGSLREVIDVCERQPESVRKEIGKEGDGFLEFWKDEWVAD